MKNKHYIIITEKDSVAEAMAAAYDINIDHEGNYEKGNSIEKVSIFSLSGNIIKEIDDDIKWSIDTLPIKINIQKREVIEKFNTYIDSIANSLNESIENNKEIILINACDAGREGEKIYRWAMVEVKKRLKTTKDFDIIQKRLWLQSLNKESILSAMPIKMSANNTAFGFGLITDELEDLNIEKYNNLYLSAVTRSEVDKFKGYNYTRLFTLTKEYTAKKETIIYGRCKTPILNSIYLREQEIKTFKKEEYLVLEVELLNGLKCIFVDDNDNIVKASFEDLLRIKNYLEEEKHLYLYEKNSETVTKKPPKLFDTLELQKLLSKEYNFRPAYTLKLLESLYLKKLITYPRTSSNMLTMDFIEIMPEVFHALKFGEYKKYLSKAKYDTMDISYFTNKMDSDHHAIIITNMLPEEAASKYSSLSNDEKKVFDAIAKRIIASLYENVVVEYTRYKYHLEDLKFKATFSEIKNFGFLEIYKKKSKNNISILAEDISEIKEVNIVKKSTSKPKAYKAEDILTLMKTYNIGTPATQANIIEELEKNLVTVDKTGYYKTTPLGRKTLKYIPDELKEITLSSLLEDKLKEIENSPDAKKIRLELIKEIKDQFNKIMNNKLREKQIIKK